MSLGNIVLYYSNEIIERTDDLFKLFQLNLTDSIQSVRQGAALAIANMLRSYESVNLPLVEDLLTKVEQNFMNSIENVREHQTSKKLLKQQEELESKDSALYTPYMTTVSENSSSPHIGIKKKSHKKKHHKKNKGGEDHVPSTCDDDIGNIECQKSEPWHLADGHLYLIYEISNISKSVLFKKYVLNQFDSVLKLLMMRHYIQHVNLMQSFCKIVSF